MIKYESGEFIGGLRYIKEIPGHRSPSRITRMGLFECNCGRQFETIIRSIVSGNTKSCGCFGSRSRSERFTKHGLRNHDLYKIWCGIKTRCYNKKRIDYKYYGGLGIVLSDEFHDFKTWFNYVTTLPLYGNRKELKLTLDRIQVTKDYQRGNLRWATRREQSLNQRRNSGF